MSLATHTLTHVGDGIANMLAQFRSKSDFVKFVSCYLAEIQDLEDALWQLATQRDYVSSIGAQRDGMGQILNVPRNGQTDVAYKLSQDVQISLNQSNGLINDVLNVINTALAGTSNTINYSPSYPAQFVITIGGTLANPTLIQKLMIGAEDAGVSGVLVYDASPATDATVFTFDKAGQGLDQGLLAAAVGT